MRLYEFVPIYDQVVSDDSLIEHVFGHEFFVVDEDSHLLTTAHNLNLLRRARLLLDEADSIHADELRKALADLSNRAEEVRQYDYDLAVQNESNTQDYYHEHCTGIGSLL